MHQGPTLGIYLNKRSYTGIICEIKIYMDQPAASDKNPKLKKGVRHEYKDRSV